MNIDFSIECREIIETAKKIAVTNKSYDVNTLHLGLSFLKDNKINSFLKELISEQDFTNLIKEFQEKVLSLQENNNASFFKISKELNIVIKNSFLESKRHNSLIIEPNFLFLSLLHERTEATIIFNNYNITYDTYRNIIFDSMGVSGSNESLVQKSIEKNDSKTPFIDKFCVDISKLAEEGKIDPVIGRDKEVLRMSQILCRKNKKNPILIGEPGTGKTAIVNYLALKIKNKEVSEKLYNKKLVSLSIATLVAGTRFRGDFEERFENLIKELEENQNIIIFIDELHTIMGAGGMGPLDASNMLKPALARGSIQCIGATTLKEFREHMEDDGAFIRRFQKVVVNETTVEETINILNNLKPIYEEFHKVIYSDEVIKTAVIYADKYITDRFFPDKAIDIIDEAGSRVYMENVKTPDYLINIENELNEVKEEKNIVVKNQDYEKAVELRDKEKELLKNLDELKEKWKSDLKNNKSIVTIENIGDIIYSITGIPVNKLNNNENIKLLTMEKSLNEKVIGQDKAIKQITDTIKRNRVGLKDETKPNVFLGIGVTGVGKTHLTKSLAEYLFGDKNAMIRIDMSEYMEGFNVSKLIGSPPGYIGYEKGGILTEAVRNKPYSIILLDEIEKAHPEVFNILLQVFDDGILTDGLGRKVNFKNTIILMTSNVGARKAQEFNKGVGFLKNNDDNTDEIIFSELEKTFSPEFLNRIEEIIMFNKLNKDHIKKIIEINLKTLFSKVENMGYNMIIEKSAYNFISDKGYNPKYGARPLNRAIKKYIENPLSDEILKGNVKEGNEIIFSYIKGENLSLKIK